MKGTNSHERERVQPELTGSAEQLNVRNGGQSRLSAHAALDKDARRKVSEPFCSHAYKTQFNGILLIKFEFNTSKHFYLL